MKLPDPKTYEQELKFMPWGKLIDRALEILVEEVPQGGTVIDLMCGPGTLLGRLSKARNDLVLEGVDLDEEFINFAQDKYPGVSFKVDDVTSLAPAKDYDAVVCTGGIHHLPYDQQRPFLFNVSSYLKPGGIAIFADPCIDLNFDELARKQAVAKLGYEYLIATINNGAPDKVIQAAIGILSNDVLGKEYKISLQVSRRLFAGLFLVEKRIKTWPEVESDYGDYLIVCRRSEPELEGK